MRSECWEKNVHVRPAYLTEDWFLVQFDMSHGNTTWSMKVFRFEALCNLVAEEWMLASHALQPCCEAVVEASWTWLSILVFGSPNLDLFCPIFLLAPLPRRLGVTTGNQKSKIEKKACMFHVLNPHVLTMKISLFCHHLDLLLVPWVFSPPGLKTNYISMDVFIEDKTRCLINWVQSCISRTPQWTNIADWSCSKLSPIHWCVHLWTWMCTLFLYAVPTVPHEWRN